MAKQSAYSLKLKDPRWQRVRLTVLERDEWACANCGDKTATLHVHHGYYEYGKDPWDYPLWTLRTLCESCHAEAGDLQESFKKYLWTQPIEFQTSIWNVLQVASTMRTGGDEIEFVGAISDMVTSLMRNDVDGVMQMARALIEISNRESE